MAVKIIPTNIDEIQVGDIVLTVEDTTRNDITINNNAFVIRGLQPKIKHNEIVIEHPQTEMLTSLSLEDVLKIVRVTF